eukprot:scaffold24404_cov81-Isochrysis_galbana.AAC.1
MTFEGAVVVHGGPPRGHSGDPKATDMNGLARSVKTKTLAASAHFFSHASRGRSKGRATVSESALSEGTSPVWPWTGARCLASCVPGLHSRRER